MRRLACWPKGLLASCLALFRFLALCQGALRPMEFYFKARYPSNCLCVLERNQDGCGGNLELVRKPKKTKKKYSDTTP